jgi:hypothetical protein
LVATAKSPVRAVFPVADATVNFVVATLKSPVTPRVPPTTVFPVADATVNFVVATLKSPVTLTASFRDRVPVLLLTAPRWSRVPGMTVFPVAVAIDQADPIRTFPWVMFRAFADAWADRLIPVTSASTDSRWIRSVPAPGFPVC